MSVLTFLLNCCSFLALLLHFDILDTSSSTDPSLTSTALASSKRLSSASATRLRVASVVAGKRIVDRAHELGATSDDNAWLKGMTEVDLDGWLWSLGKKGELRKLDRIEERGTVFY